MFDVIFMSYNEPNAEEHWALLIDQVPFAKRVHGVKGIYQTHCIACEMSDTEYFFTVDGDNQVLPQFNASFVTNFELTYYKDYLHLWATTNRINSVINGHGGIKLFHKDIFKRKLGYVTDMTFSINHGKVLYHPEPLSIHAFDTSDFNVWRTAIREIVKHRRHLGGEYMRQWKESTHPAVAQAFLDLKHFEGMELSQMWNFLHDSSKLHELYTQFRSEENVQD